MAAKEEGSDMPQQCNKKYPIKVIFSSGEISLNISSSCHKHICKQTGIVMDSASSFLKRCSVSRESLINNWENVFLLDLDGGDGDSLQRALKLVRRLSLHHLFAAFSAQI
jgi:hypothetical protein